MLNPITYSIVLDCTRGGTQAAVFMTQYDTQSRKISIRLTQNGEPYDIPDTCSANIRGEKSDETKFFNACTISDGAAIYSVTTQTLADAGTVACMLELTDADGTKIASPQFSIVVAASLYDDDAIESEDEFTALQTALAAVRASTITSVSINPSKHLVITFASGTSSDLGIVAGADGVSPTISVGSVTTGAAGTDASVTNSGTAHAAVFDFVIPQGVKGDTGTTSWNGVTDKPTTLSGYGITDGVSVSDGTLQSVVAAASTPCNRAAVRNVYAGTEDMTAGVTPLPTGEVYFVYE